MYAESVFGRLDYMLQQMPRVSTVAVESFVRFSQKNTLGWLNEKKKKARKNIK